MKNEKTRKQKKTRKTMIIIAAIVVVIISGIWILGSGTSFEPSLPEFPLKAEPVTTEQELAQAQNDISSELANLSSDLQSIKDALG